MEQYICIHGHFYQPPRENAWLETIQVQDSAYPYHDWNERITAECYAPNATARIMDGQGRIAAIANNYAKISFDFGPTLLVWLERQEPEVYAAILAADRDSRRTFAGHGNALAQAYNHLILPLANKRDKYTQVHWGIRDFEHRFGRLPEGMWLPETAADLETLDVVAELGIRFTVLSPHQARQVRRLGGRTRIWRDAAGGSIDPTMAYELRLPSGRTMSLFFYDGPISRAAAFEGVLYSGEQFAQRLAGAFLKTRTHPQLVHIATDGETYGHHHRFGDMALAYALHSIEVNGLARLTNYGEYLEKYPPTHEVEIVENTSWSCAHGIERWRSHCGCNSGAPAPAGRPAWTQAWRGPLRTALDALRDALAPRFETQGRLLLRDPWQARNDYIAVVLDRSPESVERFLGRHAAHALTESEKSTALKLLELQRHAMLMYTSCGWFFDELSGIETVQVLQHAGRALQLAEEVFVETLAAPFLQLLEKAPSNVPEHRDGRHLFEQIVKPATVNWEKVAAHYAMNSLFEEHPEQTRVHCYLVDREDYQSRAVGKAKLVVGRVRVTSAITWEPATLTFGFVYLGDHNLFGGIRTFEGHETYRALVQEATHAFAEADFPAAIHCLGTHLGALTCSLKSLFRDEQRKILNRISHSTLAEAEAVYRQLYANHTPLFRFLTDLGVPLTFLSVPLPKALQTAAEFIVNIDLRRAFEEETLDLERIRALLKEAGSWRVVLDTAGLAYVLKQQIERLAMQLRAQPTDYPLLQRLEAVVELARSLSFEVDFRKAQNVYYELMLSVLPPLRGMGARGDDRARAWVANFVSLGERLRVRLPEGGSSETKMAPQAAG